MQLSTAEDRFVMPFMTMPFSLKNWNSDPLHRSWFLFDIAHDYSIIGMNHSELVAILGEAVNIPNVVPETDSNFDCVDWYSLSGGCSGTYGFLEIGYKDGKAVGFRVGSPDQRRLRKPS